MKIARHKAAIRRTEPSLPVKCLLRDQLLASGSSFFDYGCGHGEDIRHLQTMGYDAHGWDPAHRPEILPRAADAINLGYVLNVIEDLAERTATLCEAWKLCRRVLVVAARILVGGRGSADVEYSDGIVTRIGTFQKFFTQTELAQYIEGWLGSEAIPAAPGVFYVFRDECLREQFLSTRYRRQEAAPRKRASELRFEEHRELLTSLMEWIDENGRTPEADEISTAVDLIAEFGSIKGAFALVRRMTGGAEWEQVRKRRSEDLLVYMALMKFRRRPSFSQLPLVLQRDIQSFFGTFKKACEQADELLFRAGNADAIDDACKRSSIGKLLPNALYVHRSALDELGPLLRVYEGCARTYLGEIEGANLIKLHRFSGKVSYLVYPTFEIDPHPALLRSVKLSLRTRELECFDYSKSDNPPILHRKESFLSPEHPLFGRFSKLTQQEERHGLLDETSSIGTRDGWCTRLAECSMRMQGHRLIRAKASDGTADKVDRKNLKGTANDAGNSAGSV